MKIRNGGFTLIELLVVVLIIGILAAIAVPQYQKAVLKSRFSSLMPTTQAIRDGQEMYYMTNGRYADAVNKLDVTTANTDDMTITLSDDDDYAYTMATRPNINNNLIMYQKHSVQFPGEIHCEALKGNSHAEWLCGTALHAIKELGEGITPGYTEYVIEGPGMGFTPAQLEAAEVCNAATALGLTCNITTNAQGQKVKQVCQNGFCRTRTYNEDGSYTSVTCKANSENVCTSDGRFVTYDKKGNKLIERTCFNFDNSGNNCTRYSGDTYNYTYDAKGNMLTQRHCSSVNDSENCTAYNRYYNYDYTYDAKGNMLTQRMCNIGLMDNKGNCTQYVEGIDYTYDANGNMLTQRKCTQVYSSGKCRMYSTDDSYGYTYDANGNQTQKLRCKNFDNAGKCTAYAVGSYSYTAWDEDDHRYTATALYPSYAYSYDANGNRTGRRTCMALGANGICTAYHDSGYTYTYDANGNKLTQRTCSSFDSSGICKVYSNNIYDNYDYTYDDNGKQLIARMCSSVNTSTGECIAYWSTSASAN